MGTLLLGEIESSLLQGYFGELRTKEVVVTEERMDCLLYTSDAADDV